MQNVGADHLVVPVEVELDEFSEARRVVISRGFGIAKGFKKRVGGQDTLLEVGHVTAAAVRVGEVPQQVLGRLGLTSTRLTAYQDGLGAIARPGWDTGLQQGANDPRTRPLTPNGPHGQTLKIDRKSKT